MLGRRTEEEEEEDKDEEEEEEEEEGETPADAALRAAAMLSDEGVFPETPPVRLPARPELPTRPPDVNPELRGPVSPVMPDVKPPDPPEEPRRLPPAPAFDPNMLNEPRLGVWKSWLNPLEGKELRRLLMLARPSNPPSKDLRLLISPAWFRGRTAIVSDTHRLV